MRNIENIHTAMQSKDCSRIFTTQIAPCRDVVIRKVARYHSAGPCIYTDGSELEGGAGSAAVHSD